MQVLRKKGRIAVREGREFECTSKYIEKYLSYNIKRVVREGWLQEKIIIKTIIEYT
jgi:hypothetical protein